MKSIGLIFLFLSFCLFFGACQDDMNDFSSDPNLTISFSADTIRFDTLFTELGSPTKRVKVYNRSNENLKIQSVELVNAATSGFRMNVDGEAGNKITDVILRKNDSMFIFIEATIKNKELGNGDGIMMYDSIRFNFNGKNQYIQLEAAAQDAERWYGKVIEQDTTITGTKPFLIYDSLIINEGVTLNIEKNARLHFRKGVKVIVKGRINAIGTVDEPIILRGDRYDNILTDVPYNNIPGQWGGISIDSASFNNIFESVHIRNTEWGIVFEKSDPNQLKAKFTNCIIHNSLSDGVSAINCKIEAYNSLFSNAKDAVVKIYGGYYSFIHCTLVNQMSWVAGSTQIALIAGNTMKDSLGVDIGTPIQLCNFFNCILVGKGSYTEALQLNNANTITFDHNFSNCLIKPSKKSNDTNHFFDNIWNEDPMFKDLNINLNQNFSFELDSASAAIDMAKLEYSLRFPTDLNGVSRLSDKAPDIGCYEWVKPEEEKQRKKYK